MKIAILGGSFDPPHIGHILIATQVQEQLAMDEVWLMPAYQHPFQRKLTPEHVRFQMLKTLETKKIQVSDFEIKHNPTSFTIDTLTFLSALYPQHTFYWIMGSDQLEHFQKYRDWEKIIQQYHLIIFPREWMLPHLDKIVKEKLHLQTIPDTIIILNTPDLILTNLSSTIIKQRIKNNLPTTYMLTPEVEKIIQNKKMYV